jgi:hypothetical protein
LGAGSGQGPQKNKENRQEKIAKWYEEREGREGEGVEAARGT